MTRFSFKTGEIEAILDARNELWRLSRKYHFKILAPLDFIETVLPMANQHSTTQERTDAFLLVMHGPIIAGPEEWDTGELPRASSEEVTAEKSHGFGSTQVDLGLAVSEFWGRSAAERSKFRQMLDQVYQGKPETTQTYLKESYEDIVLVPTLRWIGSKPELTIKYCPVSTGGVLGYALALLLDRNSKHFQYLRICSLNSCDDYFLSRKTGADRQRKLKYCNDKHLRLGAAQQTARRTAKYRKRLAKHVKKVPKVNVRRSRE